MEFQIIKSPIPIIWLDSSVIINLKDIKQGKKATAGYERYSRIYELVLSKVREGKMICPAGDQNEEYEFGNDARDCNIIQDALCHGIHFIHRSKIQMEQLVRYAQAYANGQEQVILSYKSAFDRDPIYQLKSNGLIVSVHLTMPGELIDKFKLDHQKAVTLTEELRVSNLKRGITFKEQLAREYNARVQAAQVVAHNWNSIVTGNKTPTLDDYFQFQAIDSFLAVFQIVGSLDKTLTFFDSDIYKSAPFTDISCNLYAERVTSTTPIESGDYMDIEHIATLLPYCDMLVTDKKMKNRIKRFNFDSKYRTRVYSMSDFDQLVGDLEAI